MSIKDQEQRETVLMALSKGKKTPIPSQRNSLAHKLPVKHQIIVVTVLEGRSLLSVALYLLH